MSDTQSVMKPTYSKAPERDESGEPRTSPARVRQERAQRRRQQAESAYVQQATKAGRGIAQPVGVDRERALHDAHELVRATRAARFQK